MSAAVHMTAAAWVSIRAEVNSGPCHLETGGILLGHDFGDVLQVTVAGDPGPGAQRSRNAFLRDRDYASQLAAAAWDVDRSSWIGEWHTHPSSMPVPSPVDLASYDRHLLDSDLNFERFLSIIIGVDEQGNSLVAGWLVTRGAVHLVPVSIGDPQ